MRSHGLLMSGKYLQISVILATLFGMLLLVLSNLKKRTTLDKSAEIYSIIKSYGFNDQLAMFITAQSAHESAGWTSPVFKSHNNAFGMKKADLTDYETYTSLSNSVSAFVQWYIRHRNNLLSLPLFINSIESYVRFLKNGKYFEATEAEYLTGCKNWFNKLFV